MFQLEKVQPLSTLMVVCTLYSKNDTFRPQEDNKDILDPRTPYLSVIGAFYI